MKNLSYRQGILTVSIDDFKAGELIHIISEEKTNYLIKKCFTSQVKKINKNYIKIT